MVLMQQRWMSLATPLAVANEFAISSHQMLVATHAKTAANHTNPWRRSRQATATLRAPITKSEPTTHHDAASTYSQIASAIAARSNNRTVKDDHWFERSSISGLAISRLAKRVTVGSNQAASTAASEQRVKCKTISYVPVSNGYAYERHDRSCEQPDTTLADAASPLNRDSRGSRQHYCRPAEQAIGGDGPGCGRNCQGNIYSRWR